MDVSATATGPSPAPDQSVVNVADWIVSAEQVVDRLETALVDTALALPHLDRELLWAGTVSMTSAPRVLALSLGAGGVVMLIFMLSSYGLRGRREAAARERVPFLAVLKRTAWSLVPLLAAIAVGRAIAVRLLSADPLGDGFAREFLVSVIYWLSAITFLGIVFSPRTPQLRLLPLDESGAEKGLRRSAVILACGYLMVCLLAAAARVGMPPNSVRLLAILGAFAMTAAALRLLHLLRRHGLTPLLHMVAAWMILLVSGLWIWGWLMQQFDLYQGIKGTTIALMLALAFDRSIALSIQLSRKPEVMRRLFVVRVVIDALAAAVILRLIVENWLVGTLAVIPQQDWPRYSRQINFSLMVLVLAAVLAAVTHAWVESRMMPKEALTSLEDAELHLARMTTVLPILRVVLLGLIGSIFSLVTLSVLGVDTTPIIAGAGILGLAISLGSQALVKDVISGIFWMLDDAFRLGEEIEIDSTPGRVEQILIRSLRLRGLDDRLHTIPYGQIETVVSRSRGLVLARVSLRLENETDAVGHARLLRLAASTLRSETRLQADIVGKIAISPPEAHLQTRELVLSFNLARAAAVTALPLIRSLLLEVLEASGFDLAPDGVHVSLAERRATAAPVAGTLDEVQTP